MNINKLLWGRFFSGHNYYVVSDRCIDWHTRWHWYQHFRQYRKQHWYRNNSSNCTWVSLYCFCLLFPIPAHQPPVSDVPADLSQAGGHLTGSDGSRAEQGAAGCFLQPHSCWTNTGDFPGLFAWTTGHWALWTQQHTFYNTHYSLMLRP